jgi:predicted transcriptional regulator
MVDTVSNAELLSLTTEIVSSHLANNAVSTNDIPDVIKQVHKTLTQLSVDGGAQKSRPQPAVPIKKSILPDYIICLEDGKHLKMLKRHLKSVYDMTPEDYRERWNLPADYPMVAPNYAEKRSQLAKDIGLGTKNNSVK